MKKLFINVREIVGVLPEAVLRKEGDEMSSVECLRDAWLLVDGGRIAGFGRMCDGIPVNAADAGSAVSGEAAGVYADAGFCTGESVEIIDAADCMLMPAFCDPHTHIVYAGSRENEFIDKIRGLSYEEMAANGGGILNSADLLHGTSEDELFRQSMERVREMISRGTGAMEIKSGYGLTLEDELKMLRVIRRIRESVPAVVKATFLGAHAVGRAYAGRQGEYVDLVCDRMIPAVAEEGLADFVDVFCDEGFFTVPEAERIMETGRKYGLIPKIHANEIACSGGVQAGVKFGALSVDHLERAGEAEITALKDSETMPTMLPGSSFFLGLPYGRARDFIGAGLGVALASDYNPGSSPCGDMHFVWAQACIKMRLTPEQAFNACTLNAAYAMGISRETGSITRGKTANLILTRPGVTFYSIPYFYTRDFIRRVYLNGVIQSPGRNPGLQPVAPDPDSVR